jgi:hypothetical protein
MEATTMDKIKVRSVVFAWGEWFEQISRVHREPTCGLAWMSDEAITLSNKLDEMLNAYNRDNSDIQTDYFDVHFYGNTSFDSDLSHADRVRVTATIAALQAWQEVA